MNYHRRYIGLREPVSACLVGGGAFGQSFLAQARFIRRLSARIAVDLTAETAAAALVAAGFAPHDIRLCATAQEAKAAFDSGHAIAAAHLDSVIDLPFHILIEATGHPEAAAIHTLKAIDAKRHVLLVTKETDSVAGPMLAHLARKAGVGITPVDGDQPALLIDLVTWAETLGFDILCAGKSSEYDFVFDAASGALASNGREAHLPDLAQWWSPGDRGLKDVCAGRAAVIRQAFPLKAVPDLCEMTLVANACGLGPDIPAFHAPVARVPEVAALLSSDRGNGLLSGKRRLDVFHHLRAHDEASFAGGVFVTVSCQDRTSWQVLAEKGHVVSADGASAMIYLPRHLLGVEAATSVLDLAGLGQSTYPDDYAPHMDLVAVATQDLAAGTRLDAVGHHHTIEGVTAEMRPMTPLAADQTTPYYLVANRVLARPVARGSAIRLSDLEIAQDSPLLTLRRKQDATFAVAPANA
ncbi:MAG: SAF domain-containing protein [Beijerinckiaceae bacterium]